MQFLSSATTLFRVRPEMHFSYNSILFCNCKLTVQHNPRILRQNFRCARHEGMQGTGGTAATFLPSVLHGGKRPVSSNGRTYSRERKHQPPTKKAWLGRRSVLDAVDKRVSRSSSSQPSRYSIHRPDILLLHVDWVSFYIPQLARINTRTKHEPGSLLGN